MNFAIWVALHCLHNRPWVKRMIFMQTFTKAIPWQKRFVLHFKSDWKVPMVQLAVSMKNVIPIWPCTSFLSRKLCHLERAPLKLSSLTDIFLYEIGMLIRFFDPIQQAAAGYCNSCYELQLCQVIWKMLWYNCWVYLIWKLYYIADVY